MATTPANFVYHYMEIIKPGMSRLQVRQLVIGATNLCIRDHFQVQGDPKYYAEDGFGFSNSTENSTLGLFVGYVQTGDTYVVRSVTKTDESMSVANADLMKCPPPASS